MLHDYADIEQAGDSLEGLKAEFDSPRFREWIERSGIEEDVRNRILERMKELNGTINGDSLLGQQYAVGHSVFTLGRDGDGIADWDAWYESVVEYESRQLLEECWFNQPSKTDDEVRKLKAQPSNEPDQGDGGDSS